MKNSEDLALKYYLQINNGSKIVTSCGQNCRYNLFCKLSYGVNDDINNCRGNLHGSLSKIIDIIYGPWTYKYE